MLVVYSWSNLADPGSIPGISTSVEGPSKRGLFSFFTAKAPRRQEEKRAIYPVLCCPCSQKQCKVDDAIISFLLNPITLE